MLKRDFNKIKKVVKHKNNNIEHIQPIHRLIGLFKTKWDGNPLSLHSKIIGFETFIGE